MTLRLRSGALRRPRSLAAHHVPHRRAAASGLWRGQTKGSYARRIAIGVLGSALAIAATAPAYATKSDARRSGIENKQLLILRAYAPDVTGYAGPVSTRQILPSGALYVADVGGRISYWAAQEFTDPTSPWNTVCGKPELVFGRNFGIDAEFVFGRPAVAPCPTLPQRFPNFEVSTGGAGFSHPAPFGGPYSAPTPHHLYSYPLVGTGEVASFRLKDDPNGHPATADNYGFLWIYIRPAVPSDCAGGQYLLFGEPTEAACIAAT